MNLWISASKVYMVMNFHGCKVQKVGLPLRSRSQEGVWLLKICQFTWYFMDYWLFCNQTLHFDEPELRTCKTFGLFSSGSLSEGFKAWKDWNIWSGLEVYQITNKTKSHVHCCDACKMGQILGPVCTLWVLDMGIYLHGSSLLMSGHGGSFIPRPCLGNYISYSFLS